MLPEEVSLLFAALFPPPAPPVLGVVEGLHEFVICACNGPDILAWREVASAGNSRTSTRRFPLALHIETGLESIHRAWSGEIYVGNIRTAVTAKMRELRIKRTLICDILKTRPVNGRRGKIEGI